MSYQLRPYQNALIAKIVDAWQRKKRRVIAVAPTGSGKTIVFAKLIEQYLSKNNKQVLVVAHREELILQAQAKIASLTATPIGIIKYGYPPNLNAPIQIASIQSLSRNLEDIEINPRLIIIDEVHHAASDSYRALLAKFPTSYVLGMTATPVRTDGRGFDDQFDELIVGASVAELIKLGYLAPFKIFGAKLIQIKDTKIRYGDYDRQSLIDEIDRSLVYGDLVAAYQKYAPNTKTVVFCVDIAHSQQTAAAYLAAGISAEHIDGEVDYKERKAILDRFRSGETQVLTNCELILEGFDLDDIQTVQIVRPTASLALYLQTIGRVLRTHPDKPYATIIDHTPNIALFGLPDHPHQWSLAPTPAPLSRWVQKCPRCDHIFRAQASESKVTRQTRAGIPRQYGMTICPCCQTRFEFLIERSGLLFNAGIPQRIVTEVADTAIVELGTKNQPKLTAGKPSQIQQTIVKQTVGSIHADMLKIITNIIEGSESSKIAVEAIGQLPMTEDFGFTHWQYIGAKLGYKSHWAKTAFYKYTVRKRLKIRTDKPDAGLQLIYAIVHTIPTEPVLHPENWTSERESAENYIQFSLSQGKRYYLVPLMRTASGEWKVAVQVVGS
ncbi:MAG: DEAD/DEAH box helicase [Chamaesiphon sp.]|nr:DEAD/DEAH box helicase [Chamaesiphon sp.]